MKIDGHLREKTLSRRGLWEITNILKAEFLVEHTLIPNYREYPSARHIYI